METFHRHPDGVIFVRAAAGVYRAAPADFEADYGQCQRR